MSKPSKLSWLLALCCIVPLIALAQASKEGQTERYAAEGQQALAAGQFDTARTDFEQLAKLQPGVAEVHATLAAIYFQQHEYELAVHAVRAAQRFKPSLPRLDTLLGLSLSELGQFQEALPHLEKGFKQSADPDVRRMCGLQLLRAYTGLSRDSDAVEAALALNKLYPDDPEVLYHTGRNYGNFANIVIERRDRTEFISDIHTPEQRSRNMAAIKCKDTRPEIRVRSLLHSLGFRFRLHRKDLPGKPDIVLPKYRNFRSEMLLALSRLPVGNCSAQDVPGLLG